MRQLEDLFSVFPLIESERLILRQLTPEDAPDFFACYADPEVFRYSRHSEGDLTRISEAHAEYPVQAVPGADHALLGRAGHRLEGVRVDRGAVGVEADGDGRQRAGQRQAADAGGATRRAVDRPGP